MALSSVNVTHAQTNAYWDVNGTNSGQGGTGAWTGSGTNWTTNSVNATTNGGGPIGGGTFAVASGAAGATLTNSGNYIFNFGGTAGTINQASSYQAWGVNFLTSGYIWNIDGNGTNGRTITTTNGVNLNANSLTLANGARGLNTFTFAGPTTATAVGITGSNGATLTLRNLVADSASNSFGVYLSGGTISSNIVINVDIGTGSKIFFGSQSSATSTVNANIVLNTNASGVALNITNTSGLLNLNGVISGANGMVLDNSGSGKIVINGANTYSGGTTVNGTGTGQINLGTSSALGTGTVTISAGSTAYIRGSVNALDITNAVILGTGSTLQLSTTNSGWKSTWSGVISGAGGVEYGYSDSGLYLTGTNSSFGGGVNVSSSGALYVNKLGMIGSNSSIGTNGVITVSSSSGTSAAATIRWQGSVDETSDKNFVLTTASSAATAGLKVLADGATNATLTLNGNINSTGISNKVITLAGYNTNTLVMNGTINETAGYTNSLVVGASSSGTVVLGNSNNSFSGAITVTNSTSGQSTYLSTANIGNAGANSALGKNGTINIGSGSSGALTGLKYTGTGEISDKVINLAGTTGGAILDQSGTGNLKFTSAMTATGVGAKTITLTGSTAGTGELAGAITNLGGNVISLSKSGTGTWTLSGNNSYTGNTTINGGTLATGADEVLSDNNVVTVGTGATFRLGGNETVASVAGAGTADLQSYRLIYGGTGTTAHSALAIGTGGLVKNGSGFLTLGQSNSTYSGGFTLNSGTVRYSQNGVVSNGVVTSGVFGTGTLTINGGTLMGGGAGGLYVTRMLVNSNFAVNVGTYSNSSDNGRTSFAGVMDLAGDTRTITLGRWTNAASVLASGWESFRFQSNNLLPATITNGTVRFVREGSGSSSDYAAVNFNAGMVIAPGVGITIGTNVITTIASSDPWGVTTAPDFTVERGGILNLSTDNGARSITVRTLGGAGLVTSLGVTNATSTLTINSQAGDTATFTGQIVDGSSLNATLGTVANNLGVALTKTGSGTQILSGSNSYSGATTIRDTGLLKLSSTAALSQNTSLLGSSSSSTVGTLDLMAGGDYVANSFGTAATGGFSMNFTNSSGSAATLRFTNAENYITLSSSSSGGRTLLNQSADLDLKFDGNIEIGSSSDEVVAFGGTGNFRVGGAIKNSGIGVRGLEKTGAGTLTLAGSENNYNGSTSVKSGTLTLLGSLTGSTNVIVGTSGSIGTASATRTATATLDVKSGAALLNNSTTTVYSGGNLIVNGTAGSVVLESDGLLGGAGTVGSVELKSGSFLNPGNSPGTLTATSAVWNGGATYNFQISALTGTAGTSWDLFSVTGLLDASLLTDSSKFNLVVISDGGFTGWGMADQDYAYTFARAASLNGFGGDYTAGTDITSYFNISSSGLLFEQLPNYQSNPTGEWKVVVGDTVAGMTDINLIAVGVPEPSTGTMLVFGLVGLLGVRAMKRKASHRSAKS